MLPNHAPLIVAEQFGTLEALYPGRIDLGLGRAPGGDFHTMRALRRDLRQSGDDFPELLEELRTYLGPAKPGQVVKATPGQGSNVPVILLGSSDFSARLAANLGLPFAFAAHFAPDQLEEAARLYRTLFRPSEVLEQPWLMIGVQVIAAESDAAARRLFTTPQQRFLRLIRNQPVELLPPVDSMDGLWTDWERAASALQEQIDARVTALDGCTFEIEDMWAQIKQGIDDPHAAICLFPPAYRKGYDRMFPVEGRIAWSEPKVPQFDPALQPKLYDMLRDQRVGAEPEGPALLAGEPAGGLAQGRPHAPGNQARAFGVSPLAE